MSSKVRIVKAMVFPVVMYGCESWTIKKAESQRIDVFELWYWRRSNQSILKEISPEYSLKRLILWLPDVKNWLLRKDPDAGKDWRWEEKGTTEDEMAGWHHWLDGHESGWTAGVGEGQGGLACCDSWGRKESDTTERLIWSDLRKLFLWEEMSPGWRQAREECGVCGAWAPGNKPGASVSPERKWPLCGRFLFWAHSLRKCQRSARLEGPSRTKGVSCSPGGESLTAYWLHSPRGGITKNWDGVFHCTSDRNTQIQKWS